MTGKNLLSFASVLLVLILILAFSNHAPKQSHNPRHYSAEHILYPEVKIGNQVWMAENLNVGRFRNGDSITEVQSDKDWILAGKNKQPAWCYYQNDSANGARFGRIYNYFAITDARGLAPAGWQIPDNKKWMELSDFLGGYLEAGKKLKSSTGWLEQGNGTDETGFNALPGGGRYANGTFLYLGESTGFWSTSARNVDTAWFRYLTAADGFFHDNSLKKAAGMYVRCVRK